MPRSSTPRLTVPNPSFPFLTFPRTQSSLCNLSWVVETGSPRVTPDRHYDYLSRHSLHLPVPRLTHRDQGAICTFKTVFPTIKTSRQPACLCEAISRNVLYSDFLHFVIFSFSIFRSARGQRGCRQPPRQTDGDLGAEVQTHGP